jgi:predicted DNA-binding transcriptional regulator YafY
MTTATPTFTVNAEFTEDIVEVAIRHGKQIKIGYLDKKGNAESRVVEPFEIVNGKNFGGYCQLRKAYRNFSFDRVVRIILLDFDRIQEPPAKA